MEQQGGDASADNEVMSILSSPGRQKNFVVKPQPRAGGHSVTGSGALCPPSPGANGQCLPGSAAAADSYLQNSSSTTVGGGGSGVGGGGRGADSGLQGSGGVVDPGRLMNGPSPPHTPGLPKSTSASWDPHVQSSSSAFSVPAGRAIGGGGRGEGAGGAGGVGMGSAGFGGLGLGGFAAAGGDLRDFQVRLGVSCAGLWV